MEKCSNKTHSQSYAQVVNKKISFPRREKLIEPAIFSPSVAGMRASAMILQKRLVSGHQSEQPADHGPEHATLA